MGFHFPEGILSRVVSLSVMVVWVVVYGCIFCVANVSDPCMHVGCIVVVGTFG